MFTDLPKYVFFTGKGGVGKTSLACATAVSLVEQGSRVLLVSTDPASNIGQVFETTLGNEVRAIKTVPGLDAIEVDPEAAAQAYRDRILTPLAATASEDEIRSATEQLSGACTTEIAAFDEFTSLLTDPDLVDQYDHVIFDTAPTGHTIRLLKLPGAWSGFLSTGKGDASCLGPLAGLDKQKARYAEAVERLSDGEETRLILVARPRTSALKEVARTSEELAAIGLRNQQLAINGVMPAMEMEGNDALAQALYDKDQAALAEMPKVIRQLPREDFPLRPENLVGLDALKRFARNEPAPTGQASDSPADVDYPDLSTLVDDVEPRDKGLLMFMGKGGVGKTTMAAAFAAELARWGRKVLLTTTDPAAHLSETLGDALANLTVSRIDPAVEIERYKDEVMQRKGKHLDAEGLAMLEEDLRSPCTEEIAVFQAFSRVIRESSKHFVVMDTAPTGHTLLLLDTTGSYHQDMLRHSGNDKSVRMVTPMMRLQDPDATQVMIVTLAETTPILEAEKLQQDLRRAGIEPWAWIINASLAAADTQHPLLAQRARAEHPQIDKVASGLAARYAVVPMQAEDPTGADRLLSLVNVQG
ncbi:arsenical pump-driving ATPase [Natronospirillum operosum]|uniref:Arsenical pump-driving ATPase n=1 Tax=Natronospirillum operosum TaxID=2759953 RepID=A0A4Z0WCX6_9GAMM|nr:arsenical pump-driving ATPase [Natronospirillum operosum]TGG92434.1 arsenical pump-driving ATPase [Natronospirillum operosum]